MEDTPSESQVAIDRVVAAVAAGEDAATEDLHLIEQELDSADGNEIGTFISGYAAPEWDEAARDELADGTGPFGALWGFVDEERIEELVSGADEPTAEETEHVEQSHMESELESNGASAYAHCLKATNGDEAWIGEIVSGHSFSGLGYEYVGPFANEYEVSDAISDLGYLSTDIA